MSFFRVIAVPALAATALAACSTTTAPEPLAPVTTRSAAPAAPVMAAPVRPVRVPGPSPDTFIGRPVDALEALLGEPDLVRREGANEFRRYDVSDSCRAYAVVMPAGGNVASLTTGHAVQGVEAPAFEDCTAREVVTGA